MQKKHCITHERMEVIFSDIYGENKAEFHFNGGWICEGPFAECPPPELPEDWELMIGGPSFEELVVMNITSNQLRMDLEGA